MDYVDIFVGLLNHAPGSMSMCLEAPFLLLGPEHLSGGLCHGKF